MRAMMSCALVVMMGGAFQNPAEPDFSGRWVLVSPSDVATDVATALTVRQPIVRQTAQGVPMQPWFKELTVERQSRAGTASETHLIGVGGGSYSGTVGSEQRTETRETVKWADNTLVIDTWRHSGPKGQSEPHTEHREVWRFDAEGKLVITITDRGLEGESKTTTLTYRRELQI